MPCLLDVPGRSPAFCLVLCVLQLVLTDGWYWIRASGDERLTLLARRGCISQGEALSPAEGPLALLSACRPSSICGHTTAVTFSLVTPCHLPARCAGTKLHICGAELASPGPADPLEAAATGQPLLLPPAPR